MAEKTLMIIREIAEVVVIKIGLCHGFFSYLLDIKCVVAKFVLKMQNFYQKNRRTNIALELLDIELPKKQ